MQKKKKLANSSDVKSVLYLLKRQAIQSNISFSLFSDQELYSDFTLRTPNDDIEKNTHIHTTV